MKTDKQPNSLVLDKGTEKKRIVKKGGVKKVRGGDDINDLIYESINKLTKTKKKQD